MKDETSPRPPCSMVGVRWSEADFFHRKKLAPSHPAL
jgi:hypothetical protein